MKPHKIQKKPETVRINKYIAETSSVSRRGADELILEGKVKVNGKIVTEPGLQVSPKDKVLVDGKILHKSDKKYVIFNKPPGYITTRNDENGRKTIYDILPPDMQKLKPAGRLDRESAGLILLTNDGDLIMELTHPKYEIPKVYRVTVQGKVTVEHLFTMEKGIEIEKGKIAYAQGIILDYDKGMTTLEIVLYQGYNRQIRKMFESIERPVVSLKRLSHGNLNITGLDKGKYRYLRSKEVQELFNYIKKYKVKNR